MLLASLFVPFFWGMTSLSALHIIELNVVSVAGSSRVIELSVVHALTVVRASPDCCAGFTRLSVARASSGGVSRVLRHARCHARYFVGYRATSCMLQDQRLARYINGPMS